MSITHNQLIAMLAVIDCGTFDRAAVRLNLSQSTITKRIQELETSTGILVFDRSKRQAILTQQGEQFAALARETVASFTKLSSFNSEMKPSSKRIRLGVTEISSLTWLPRFLEISFEDKPDIQFDLTIDMSRNLHSSLEDGDLDLVVVPEMPFQSNAEITRLGGIDVALIGRPGLFPAGETVDLSCLHALQFITQGKTSGYSKSIRDWFANNGGNTRNSVSVDSLHAMVGLAVAGRGVCITPRSYLIRLIESGRVVEIPTEPPLPAMQYCVVHYPSPHAALFTQIAHDIHSVADFGTPYFV